MSIAVTPTRTRPTEALGPESQEEEEEEEKNQRKNWKSQSQSKKKKNYFEEYLWDDVDIVCVLCDARVSALSTRQKAPLLLWSNDSLTGHHLRCFLSLSLSFFYSIVFLIFVAFLVVHGNIVNLNLALPLKSEFSIWWANVQGIWVSFEMNEWINENCGISMEDVVYILIAGIGDNTELLIANHMP